MSGRLITNVHIDGQVYGPDGIQDVPDHVAAQIGDHAWEGGKAPSRRAARKAAETQSDAGADGDDASHGEGDADQAQDEPAQEQADSEPKARRPRSTRNGG
jgi:hypothetical protein